jgi:hypothetical protein
MWIAGGAILLAAVAPEIDLQMRIVAAGGLALMFASHEVDREHK